MKVLVWKDDDYLYQDLIEFLYEIKVVQGGSTLYSKLLHHPKVMAFLKQKQHERMLQYEGFFSDSGALDEEMLEFAIDNNLNK